MSTRGAKSPGKSLTKSPRAKSPAAGKAKSPKGKSAARSPRAAKPASRYPDSFATNAFQHTQRTKSVTAGGKGYPVYLMLDNGGVAHAVLYDKVGRVAVIYHADGGSDEAPVFAKPKKLSGVAKLFVGKSAAAQPRPLSAATGAEYDGNTVLIVLDSGKCVVYDKGFLQFTPLAPIAKYASPVGNNDVPYPYAIDKARNLYFFPARKVIEKASEADLYHMIDRESKALFDPKGAVPGKVSTPLALKPGIPRL